VQGGVAVLVAGVDVGVVVDEELHHLEGHEAPADGGVEGRPHVGVARVREGALAEEQLGALDALGPGGQVQRGPAPAVGLRGRPLADGAAVEQKVDALDVAPLGGEVQREGVPVRSSGAHICPSVQEQLQTASSTCTHSQITQKDVVKLESRTPDSSPSSGSNPIRRPSQRWEFELLSVDGAKVRV